RGPHLHGARQLGLLQLPVRLLRSWQEGSGGRELLMSMTRGWPLVLLVLGGLTLSHPGLAEETPHLPPGLGGGSEGHGHRPGWKMLKPGQKVDFNTCEANPVSCTCPPDSYKMVFQETQTYNAVVTKRLMCVPSNCKAGQVIRKRTTLKTGQVNFVCE